MGLIATAFVRWTFLRALCHRGYWLVASLYLVADARLSPFQLVFLGTAQGLVSLLFEVPAGVLADTISRKKSLLVSHLLIGASMIATGLATSFPALVATQMLWGIGWTFASGADVAWITDESDDPETVAPLLALRARWEQVGSAGGMIAVGALAWATSRSLAMVVAGGALLLLGVYILLRFPERRFVPAPSHRARRSWEILRRGVELVRQDRALQAVFLATFLVNGAAEAFGRLHPKRLLALGFPGHLDPIVWLTGLGIATYFVGALALRWVEAGVRGGSVAPRVYAAACGLGALGLLALAAAPDALTGCAGALLVGGVAVTVTRTVGEIQVNAQTASAVRATVHSGLAQVEYLGEILPGCALGVVAQRNGLVPAFAGAAVLLVAAGLMATRVHSRVEGGHDGRR